MIPPEILKSVVFLCPPRHGTPVADDPKGTGFFVRHLQEGMEFPYVVTARHSVDRARAQAKERGLDDTIYLRLNTRNGSLAHVATSGADWVFHPGSQPVDVAVLPFDRSRLREFDVDFFPLSVVGRPDFAEGESPPSVLGIPDLISSQPVGPGDEVGIAGLFSSHSGQDRNIPILRMGNIAALPSEPVLVRWPDESNQTPMGAYLVDTRSIKGLSGAPVYVNLPGHTFTAWKHPLYHVGRPTSWYLLGLVHGHFNVPVPDTDWETATDAEAPPKANAGVCIVVPAARIQETLEQPLLADQRRVAIENRPTPGTAVTDWGRNAVAIS